MKLQNKILFPVLGFMAAGMVAISIILFVSASGEISKTVNSQIELLASELRTVLDQYIKEEKSNIGLFSEQAVFCSYGGEDWDFTAAMAEIDRITARKTEYEAIGIADLNGNVVACSDRSLIGRTNIAERQYFVESSAGKTVSSDVVKSRLSGNPVTVFSAPLQNDCDVAGVFFVSIDISGFNSKYVDTVKIGTSGYAYIIEQSGAVVAYPDKSKILELNIRDYSFGVEMLAQGAGLYSYNFNGVDKTVGFRTASENGWMIVVTADDKDIYAGINRMKLLTVIVAAAALTLCTIMIVLIIGSIVRPVKRAVKISETIASGDLSVKIEKEFLCRKDETGELAVALDSMIIKLREIVAEVRTASQTVSVGSAQLASTAESISQGASEQAATAEEVSSSMEEIGSSIRQNTDNALITADTAVKTASDAESGGEAVNEAVDAMRIITGQIKLIEEIARSTNLLALNASIEAARAGEAGRGFSVVAAEVGKLAENSRTAAAEISELAAESAHKAEIAGRLISDIVPGIKKTAELINEISTVSSEQNTAAEQVNQVMSQLDQVIQMNASSAEEATSMSEELAAQAESLLELVSYFRLGGGAAELESEAGFAADGSVGLEYRPEYA